MGLTVQQIERYSRQIVVPRMGGRAQERLLASRMLIVGDAHEVEPALSYMVGGGVGRIDLMVESEQSRAITSSVRGLNPDVSVAASASAAPDLGLAIISSETARVRAAEAITRFRQSGWIVSRLDRPARIAMLPSPPPCPRCAGDALLARFGSRIANFEMVVLAAAVEALKLLADYTEKPEPAIIEFDDYQSRSCPIASAFDVRLRLERSLSHVSAASLWLFDFDNTIARLEPEVDWAASRRELEPMLRTAGAPDPLFAQFPKGNLLLYDAYRQHLEEMVHKDGGAHAAILRDASAVIEKFELMGVDRAAPLEGALEIIRALNLAGHRVGIVTSNSSRTVKRWLDLHGVAGIVSSIVGRDSLLPLKPAPNMILEALKVAELAPSHAAYVGDSAADCSAARSAGVTFYGVASSSAARVALATAGTHVVFKSLTDLAAHLNFEQPLAGN